MIKNFVNWYIDKYWSKEFIFRKDIENAILGARRDEAKKLQEKFNLKMQDIIQRKDIEKEIAVAEVNAKCVQLKTEMTDMRQWVRGAEDVFHKSINRSKENANIAQEIYMQAQKLMEASASIYGAIDSIKTKAIDHRNAIEREEKEDREKLRLDYEEDRGK